MPAVHRRRRVAGVLCAGAFGILGPAGCDRGQAPAESAAPTASAPAAETAEAAAPTRDPAAVEAAMAARRAENLAEAEAFLAENARKDGVVVTDSGLQYEILTEGPADGDSPTADDLVTVHYAGTLIDGLEFDSSRKRGAAARFPLSGVIPGWTEGLQLMSEGDRFRFFIPPALAYGETGTPGGPIGPNSALIFDVELIDVSNAEKNLAEAEAFLAENAAREDVVTTASGLQYEVLAEGPAGGAAPSDADIVQIRYEGRLIDGSVIDATPEGAPPAEFPLGQVALAGWVEGMQLMSVGDKYRFFIPPDLAFGAVGAPNGPVGPNEVIVFDVELIDVKR